MDLSLSTKLKLSDVKAVKASVNVSNISCKSCTILSYVKKNKYLQKLSMSTFTKKKFPSLPNLGCQIRCAQNQYAAVQLGLKYQLSSGRGCGLIALFQIHGSKAGLFESNLFWVGKCVPPPKPSYRKKN